MRIPLSKFAAITAVALAAAACASDDADGAGGDVPDGPTITVASFNFAESEILGNLYGQALEDAGYPVEYQLNIGNRELILPELRDGAIDLLPEYVGAALGVGYGGAPTGDLDSTLADLVAAAEEDGLVVLEPSPGEDKDVFVTTQAFADENGLTTVSDLAGLGDITLAGPPECETRDLCYLGLTGTYGLTNVSFTGIAEGPVRIASLESGDVELITLFSTQPVITASGFVSLEDDLGITPVQNIVPVVSGEVADAYGEDMVAVLDEVSALITTEVLLDLNGRVELDAQDADDVAADFLAESGITG